MALLLEDQITSTHPFALLYHACSIIVHSTKQDVTNQNALCYVSSPVHSRRTTRLVPLPSTRPPLPTPTHRQATTPFLLHVYLSKRATCTTLELPQDDASQLVLILGPHAVLLLRDANLEL